MPTETIMQETCITIPETTAAFAANLVSEALHSTDKRKRKTAFNKLIRGLRAFELLPPGVPTGIGLAIAPDGLINVIVTIHTEGPTGSEHGTASSNSNSQQQNHPKETT